MEPFRAPVGKGARLPGDEAATTSAKEAAGAWALYPDPFEQSWSSGHRARMPEVASRPGPSGQPLLGMGLVRKPRAEIPKGDVTAGPGHSRRRLA